METKLKKEPYKCINCQKDCKCNCFDIDLDEYHAPFCSSECILEWTKRNSDSVIDCAQNFGHDFKKGGYYPLTFNGHWIDCENQFDVKNKELKSLIKDLQKDSNVWEKMAIEYNKQRREVIEKLRELKKKKGGRNSSQS